MTTSPAPPAPRWIVPEARIGLGCMRLSTEPARDDARSLDVLAAALAAGVVVLDSARAYALDDADAGHNERLIARAHARAPRELRERVRVVSKCGMRRPEGRWVPDGRAKSIAADAAASVAALDGVPVDLMLLHAPDPEVPWATSVRALAALLVEHGSGSVRHIGLSNVTRDQLDEALAIAPEIAAVELQLGWLDDGAIKGGVVARCIERGIAVLAHRPLGGLARKRSIARDKVLRQLAGRHAATPAQVALAALLDLHPSIVALPGATRVESVQQSAPAAVARVALDDDDRALLGARLSRAKLTSGPRAPRALSSDGEVVLLMGIQGAGKTDALSSWLARGYERINRDERGGTMRQLHRHLDERLASGARRVVLDNTYLARAVRREAIDVAWKHALPVRGVWLDTPIASAQVNVVLRMLAHHGRLLSPDEMHELASPSALPPQVQYRALRKLEKPSLDEGFTHLDVVEFRRRTPPGELREARIIALDALVDGRGELKARAVDAWAGDDDSVAARLVYAWRGARKLSLDVVAERVRGALAKQESELTFVECPHPAGPPICWCRPPLPGLVLAFAHAARVDLARSVVVGAGPTHRALAAAVGARWLDPT